MAFIYKSEEPTHTMQMQLEFVGRTGRLPLFAGHTTVEKTWFSVFAKRFVGDQ
jgi:hypothetical protein